MKNIIRTLLLFLMIISNLTTVALADNGDAPIVIDGNFEDWNNKPSIVDPRHDIKTPSSDITALRFIADNEYLYLSIERLAAKKTEPWQLSVIMINGLKGEMHTQVIPGYKTFESPQFDIVSNYFNSNNKSDMLVNVYLDGVRLETTFSGSPNGKNIEFRLPLEEVGLSGKNKSIKFTVKSENDEKETDWVPDGKTIVVTTGPSLWSFSYLFFFGFVFFAFKNKYSTTKRKAVLRLILI